MQTLEKNPIIFIISLIAGVLTITIPPILYLQDKLHDSNITKLELKHQSQELKHQLQEVKYQSQIERLEIAASTIHRRLDDNKKIDLSKIIKKEKDKRNMVIDLVPDGTFYAQTNNISPQWSYKTTSEIYLEAMRKNRNQKKIQEKYHHLPDTQKRFYTENELHLWHSKTEYILCGDNTNYKKLFSFIGVHRQSHETTRKIFSEIADFERKKTSLYNFNEKENIKNAEQALRLWIDLGTIREIDNKYQYALEHYDKYPQNLFASSTLQDELRLDPNNNEIVVLETVEVKDEIIYIRIRHILKGICINGKTFDSFDFLREYLYIKTNNYLYSVIIEVPNNNTQDYQWTNNWLNGFSIVNYP